MTQIDDIRRHIDSAIANLSVEDAIGFLEELTADIDGMLDGLRDDLKSQRDA